VAESDKERSDRQLSELLTELRVALPGAQVLLGFLLTTPFATRFGRTSVFERSLLYVSTLVTAAGVLFLMAPSVYHRIRWHEGGKEDVIRVGHRLFLVGTGCLAIGMFCAVFVISEVLFGLPAALPGVAVMVLIVVVVWYALPLRRGHDPAITRDE
jgi:high-affinity Fe2+/Pb2+ permease